MKPSPNSSHCFYRVISFYSPARYRLLGLLPSPSARLSGTPSTDPTQKLKYPSQKKCTLKARSLNKINTVYWVNKMKRHRLHCSTVHYQAGAECTMGRKIPDACLTVLKPSRERNRQRLTKGCHSLTSISHCMKRHFPPHPQKVSIINRIGNTD